MNCPRATTAQSSYRPERTRSRSRLAHARRCVTAYCERHDAERALLFNFVEQRLCEVGGAKSSVN